MRSVYLFLCFVVTLHLCYARTTPVASTTPVGLTPPASNSSDLDSQLPIDSGFGDDGSDGNQPWQWPWQWPWPQPWSDDIDQSAPVWGQAPAPECRPNEVYDNCGFGCPATCDDYGRSKQCVTACYGGCVCKEGLLRRFDGACVRIEDCYYPS